MLRYTGTALFLSLFLIAGIHFSGVKRILPTSDGEKPPLLPPPEPEEGMLGFARGPEIVLPEIPKSFETVGVVFYGRRSRVEILDCYLKVLHRCWTILRSATDG